MATQTPVGKPTTCARSVTICLPLSPLTGLHGCGPAMHHVAALAGHALAAGLLYDHSTPLPDAQRLQGLRVEGARDPQPFALLIVTERRARLRTEPPIQWARRKACSL
jgi:hypothetical protein